MRILVINDDGYGARGIELLKEKAKKYGEVYVVAPTFHQSGKSMSFSLDKGFTIKDYNDHECSIDGTPTDCMLLAATLYPNYFDLVLSGVNNGLNISYDTLYSGTIGAALEALNHQIPSIALSTDVDNWKIVEDNLESILDYLILNKLYSTRYCLNVNFPKGSELKGIKLTKEEFAYDRYYTWQESNGLHIDRKQDFSTATELSDLYAVEHGYISINPLKNSFYSSKNMNILKKKMEQI